MGKVVRNIATLMSPVVDVAFRMQDREVSVNLKEIDRTPSVMW